MEDPICTDTDENTIIIHNYLPVVAKLILLGDYTTFRRFLKANLAMSFRITFKNNIIL